MGDEAPTRPDVPDEEFSQDHAHKLLTSLTVVSGHLQMARRYLAHRDGPRIDRALASLLIADSHVAHAAKAVHRRTQKESPGNEAAPD